MVEKEGKERIAGWMCCSVVGDPETHATYNFAYMEWTTAAAFVVDAFEEWQTQVSGRKDAVQCKRRRELFNLILRVLVTYNIKLWGIGGIRSILSSTSLSLILRFKVKVLALNCFVGLQILPIKSKSLSEHRFPWLRVGFLKEQDSLRLKGHV